MRGILLVLSVSSVAVSARADLFGVGPTVQTTFATLQRYSPQGGYLGTVPAANPPLSEAFNSLTRGPDGHLYFLGNVLGGGSIHKVTLAGAGSATEIYSASAPPWVLNAPGGIGFDPAGRLYVGSNNFRPTGPGTTPDPTRVYRHDGGQTLTPVYTLPSTARIRDVEFDAAGQMYVGIADVGIRKLDPDDLSVAYTIATTSFNEFKFGPDGDLYVASGTAGVLRYDPDTGAALGAFVAPGAGGLVDATHMTFGDDGTLYVNDRTATAVLKYDAQSGAFQGTFLDYGPGTQVPASPQSIAYAVVPEPGAAVALVLSAAAATRRRRRRRRR
jgi:hypothetical protein